MARQTVSNFHHSRVLFVNDDGSPILFYMAPSGERSRLCKVIEHGGGLITSKVDKKKTYIRLAVSSVPVKSDDYIRSQYVRDCVEKNRILDIEKYRLREGDLSMTEAEFEEEWGPVTTRSKAVDYKGRQKYLHGEDTAIIKYLLDERKCKETRGNKIWQNMELLEITKHSWQSMHDRFRKHILPNISSYSVSADEAAYLSGEKVMEKAVTDPMRSICTERCQITLSKLPVEAKQSTPKKLDSASNDNLDELDLSLIGEASKNEESPKKKHTKKPFIFPRWDDSSQESNAEACRENSPNPSDLRGKQNSSQDGKAVGEVHVETLPKRSRGRPRRSTTANVELEIASAMEKSCLSDPECDSDDRSSVMEIACNEQLSNILPQSPAQGSSKRQNNDPISEVNSQESVPISSSPLKNSVKKKKNEVCETNSDKTQSDDDVPETPPKRRCGRPRKTSTANVELESPAKVSSRRQNDDPISDVDSHESVPISRSPPKNSVKKKKNEICKTSSDSAQSDDDVPERTHHKKRDSKKRKLGLHSDTALLHDFVMETQEDRSQKDPNENENTDPCRLTEEPFDEDLFKKDVEFTENVCKALNMTMKEMVVLLHMFNGSLRSAVSHLLGIQSTTGHMPWTSEEDALVLKDGCSSIHGRTKEDIEERKGYLMMNLS